MKELEIIESPEKAIALYQIIPKQIAERLKQYDTLKVVAGNAQSYKQVRSTLTAIVSLRTSGDARRKELGKNLRDGLSNINEGWKLLFAPVVPYEDRFKAELKAEDDRKAAIKAKKEKIEQDRIDGIRTKISHIQSTALNLTRCDSEYLKELSEALKEISIIEDEFMEFTEEAGKVLSDTSNAIQVAIIARDKFEKEEADRKAESERLEKQRVEQEETQRKIEEAQQKIQAEKDKIEATKKAEVERKEREVREKKIREEAKAKAEKDAKEKIEREERERIEREKVEEANEKRRVALLPDKSKLIKFAKSILEIDIPDLKDPKAIEILTRSNKALYEVAETVRKKANEL